MKRSLVVLGLLIANALVGTTKNSAPPDLSPARVDVHARAVAQRFDDENGTTPMRAAIELPPSNCTKPAPLSL